MTDKAEEKSFLNQVATVANKELSVTKDIFKSLLKITSIKLLESFYMNDDKETIEDFDRVSVVIPYICNLDIVYWDGADGVALELKAEPLSSLIYRIQSIYEKKQITDLDFPESFYKDIYSDEIKSKSGHILLKIPYLCSLKIKWKRVTDIKGEKIKVEIEAEPNTALIDEINAIVEGEKPPTLKEMETDIMKILSDKLELYDLDLEDE